MKKLEMNMNMFVSKYSWNRVKLDEHTAGWD